ncbi:MAG TPA: dihydrofolate reductase family protein [Streptosporangiaceae bacterium]
MAKVLWHVTMSLDGFIAGPGEDMAWMGDFVGPNPTVDELLPRIGAVLAGRRTYRPDKLEETKVYGGRWAGPQFVLTHDAPETAAPGFTFVGGDIKDAVVTAKAAAGDKYVAILGASTAQQCLDAGIVDEMLVHIAPVLLGDGVRLFSQPGGTKVKFERISCTHGARVTNLWLRPVR